MPQAAAAQPLLSSECYRLDMQRGTALISVSLTAALSISACASGPELSFSNGWEWGLRSSASYVLDADFNYLTGEIELPEEDGGTGLSLPSTTSADPDELQEALAEVERSRCERYVDPYGDDPLKSQGFEIQFLMYDTISATMAREYSDEYVEAYEAISDWVDTNGPNFAGLEYGSDAYDEATIERSQLWDSQWSEKYGDLVGERERIIDLSRELRLEMFTSGNVRAAQEYFIERCGIEVSVGYEYPSPADLGITVDEDYESRIESAQAAAAD